MIDVIRISRVLCVTQVDDNMVNRRVATSMLARYGAAVVAVNGGPEAINAVRSQKRDEAYDLVLMDIQMPEVICSLHMKKSR
jgi:CheY-like chemotaxis protein